MAGRKTGRWITTLRSDHGSNVAQAAAVALIALSLITAMMSMSPRLGRQILCAYQNLAAELGSGAASACEEPAQPPGTPQPPNGTQPPSQPQEQSESVCDKAVKGVLDKLLPAPNCPGNSVTGTVKLNGDVTVPVYGFPLKVGASDMLIVTRDGLGNLTITVGQEGRVGAETIAGGKAEVQTGKGETGASTGVTGGGTVNVGSGQSVKYNINNAGEACAALQALGYLEAKKAVLNASGPAKHVLNPILDPLEQRVIGDDHWLNRTDSVGLSGQVNGSVLQKVVSGQVQLNGKVTLGRTPTGYEVTADADLNGSVGHTTPIPFLNNVNGKFAGQYKLIFDNQGNLTGVTLVGQVESNATDEINKLMEELFAPRDANGQRTKDAQGNPVKPKVMPTFSNVEGRGIKYQYDIKDPAALAAIQESLQSGRAEQVIASTFNQAILQHNAELKVYELENNNNKYGFDLAIGEGTGARLAANAEVNSQTGRLIGRQLPGQGGQPGEIVQPDAGGCINPS